MTSSFSLGDIPVENPVISTDVVTVDVILTADIVLMTDAVVLTAHVVVSVADLVVLTGDVAILTADVGFLTTDDVWTTNVAILTGDVVFLMTDVVVFIDAIMLSDFAFLSTLTDEVGWAGLFTTAPFLLVDGNCTLFDAAADFVITLVSVNAKLDLLVAGAETTLL